MIKVVGKIGPLKDLQNALGIQKLEDFEKMKISLIEEEKNIQINTEEECKKEIYDMKKQLEKENNELINEIESNKNIIERIVGFFTIFNKKRKIGKIQKNIIKIENNFDKYISDKINTKNNFIKSRYNQLSMLKKIYYGAVGENKVVNTFKQMYGSGILINDFSKNFDKPICTKGCKDRIMSIQIDHIYINESGIFLIETKNWNENTENEGAFSPIKQAELHNHAFYIFLKNTFYYKKNPKIYNVVIFTGKYKVNSKNYRINTIRLNELKSYIQYKKPILTKEEYSKIANDLIKSNNNYF